MLNKTGGGQRPVSPIETEAITSSDEDDPAEIAVRARRERAPEGALNSVNEESPDSGPSAWLLSSEDEAEDSAAASAEELDCAVAAHVSHAAAHARRGTEVVPPAIAPIAMPEVVPTMELEPMPPVLAEAARVPARSAAEMGTDTHVSVADFDAMLAADAAAEAAAAYASESSSDGGDEARSTGEEEAERGRVREADPHKVEARVLRRRRDAFVPALKRRCVRQAIEASGLEEDLDEGEDFEDVPRREERGPRRGGEPAVEALHDEQLEHEER